MAGNVSLYDRLASFLIRAMPLARFRDTKLKHIHAGLATVNGTSDHSDVTVIHADRPRIP